MPWRVSRKLVIDLKYLFRAGYNGSIRAHSAGRRVVGKRFVGIDATTESEYSQHENEQQDQYLLHFNPPRYGWRDRAGNLDRPQTARTVPVPPNTGENDSFIKHGTRFPWDRFLSVLCLREFGSSRSRVEGLLEWLDLDSGPEEEWPR